MKETINIYDLECPIMQQYIAEFVVVNGCGHYFEKEAIDKHVRVTGGFGYAQCPCCRSIILETTSLFWLNPDIDRLFSSVKENIKRIKNLYFSKSVKEKLAKLISTNPNGAILILKKRPDLINEKLSENGESALHLFAENNNLSGVKACIEELGAKIDIEAERLDAINGTPLLFANAEGHIDVVRYLLEKGANPNAKRSLLVNECEIKNVTSVLHEAAKKGNIACCEELIKHGADLGATTYAGETPRQVAQDEKVKALFQQKEVFLAEAKSRLLEKDSESVLEIALEGYALFKNGFLDQFFRLLDKDEQVFKECKKKLILTFVNEKNYECLEYLVNKQIFNINDVLNNYMQNALHLFAEQNDITGVTLCVEKLGADVDLEAKGTNVNNGTALLFATIKNHSDIVNYLLNKGANPNLRARKNEITALHYAASKGYERCCSDLLICNADVNVTDKNDKTALHYAAEEGHASCCSMFLDYGADVGVKDKYGKTSRQKAKGEKVKALFRQINIYLAEIKSLLCDLSIGNALEIALEGYALFKNDFLDQFFELVNKDEQAFKECKRKLILTFVNDKNYECLEYLAKNEKFDINDALDEYGKSALHLFASTGDLKGVIFCVEELDAKIDLKAEGLDFSNGTALLFAAENGHADVVHYLLEKGADPNAERTVEGGGATSALHYAARKGHAACCLELLKCGANINAKNKYGKTPKQEAKGEAIKTLKTFIIKSHRNQIFSEFVKRHQAQYENGPLHKKKFHKTKIRNFDSFNLKTIAEHALDGNKNLFFRNRSYWILIKILKEEKDKLGLTQEDGEELIKEFISYC